MYKRQGKNRYLIKEKTMINLRHVSKRYGNSGKMAVEDLNWDVEDGKITGFIGPNGAGKTTTLKMITGILSPTEGEILINGKDIVKEPLDCLLYTSRWECSRKY